MRRSISMTLTVLMLILQHQKVYAQADTSISYQAFYNELSPYGQWVNDTVYGYVWIPNVNDDFRPYFTDGHWVITEFGNTWVSEYAWGWACFHYGRWTYNDYYGWIWVPGDEWGPGWVAWRWGDDVCGWAPLFPGTVWMADTYAGPEDWWIFIHPRYLYKPRYHNIWRSDLARGPHHTHTLIESTHFITEPYRTDELTFYAGPHTTEIEDITNKPIQIYEIGASSVRGSDLIRNNRIYIYRPAKVTPLNPDGSHTAPAAAIASPHPIDEPGELKIKWDQPRRFKLNMQKLSDKWNRPFVRNAPPYNMHRTTPDTKQPILQHAVPIELPRRGTNKTR